MPVDIKLPATIDIPVDVLSGNRYLRMHWGNRLKYHAELFKSIGFRWPKQSEKPAGRRIVVITSYRRKICDDDNLRIGCKPLIDVLVKHNLLRDDAPQYMKAFYYQNAISHNPGDAPHTTITISEYDGDPNTTL